MATYTLSIHRGDAGPGVPGVELGMADLDLSQEVWDWLAANGAMDEDPDVWVLVTPREDFRAGGLSNVVSWRDA